MTDPYNWYLQSGLWEVPNDPVGGANSTAKETPYYLSVKWPGDEDPIFSLTSVYVPRGRSNLAAYMAVDADAASPNYGQLRVLRMSDTTQIDGPGQTANAMVTNETVAERLRPFQQGTAQASVRQPADAARSVAVCSTCSRSTPSDRAAPARTRRCASCWPGSVSRSGSATPCRRRWTRCSPATPARAPARPTRAPTPSPKPSGSPSPYDARHPGQPGGGPGPG